MRLTDNNIINKEIWDQNGYNLPKYNRKTLIENTKKNPIWLHMGAGNIFRSFPAMLNHRLLNEKKMDKGIIVAEGFDYEIIEKAYRPFDELSLLVTLKSNGTIEKNIIGSVVESLTMDDIDDADFKRLKQIFKAESLQIVSFTITEKGYSLKDSSSNFTESVKEDFRNGPKNPKSYMGKLATLLYERYIDSGAPITMMSLDNATHNGSLLRETILTYIDEWIKNDLIDENFKEYVSNPELVSFPWSMIDKITPRPDITVQNELIKDGFEDTDIIVTEKQTYTAAFVNAEEAEYLIIEDAFPNGRPPLEKAGIIFTDKKTVEKAEKMKVSTCLNPLHTALAIFGCLLNYSTIHEEMRDPELVGLIKKIGYKEGLPVVVDPGIIDPKSFLDEVINIRFPNPFIPDSPQRIATDTSQKLSIRYGQTIQSYRDAKNKEVKSLEFIPLVLAGWLRYLMKVDDKGQEMKISPDPLLGELLPIIKQVTLGETSSTEKIIEPLLKRKDIFGVDLYQVGLAEKVLDYFEKLIDGPGAVRETLKWALSNK